MRRLAFLLSLFVLTFSSARAQFSGNVSVEGQYAPLIIETERLNTYPQGQRFELPEVSIAYDMQGVVTDFRPGILSMGANGRKVDRPWTRRKGFIDFRMGSWLNTDLEAGYAILSDNRRELDVSLDFSSSSLYRMAGVPETFATLKRKRLYSGSLGLDYSQLLGAEGLLQAGGEYGLSYFNYYGTTVPLSSLPGAAAGNLAVPYQTANRAKAYVNYLSSPSTVRGWHAEASVNYLGYRRLYGPAPDFDRMKGDRETHLSLGGGYAFNFAECNAIAVDAKGDFLFYGSQTARQPILTSISDKSRNYGIINLTPTYRLEKNRLKVRAGVDMAVCYGATGYEPDDARFYVAPDVSLQYSLPCNIGISLTATGGTTPSTLAMREKFDRYQLPYMLWTQPLYSPLDARLGVSAGPFAGFSATASFRYAIAKNTPVGGWYQQFLGAYPVATSFLSGSLYSANRQTVDLKGLEANLSLKYSYGSLLAVEMTGTYTPQKGERGVFNGFDRARWTLATKLDVKPISKLNIELGYDYRGVRNCYFYESQALPGVPPELRAWRLPDITDLNAKVSYKLLDNLDIYCRADNMLNRHVDWLPGLQTEGVVVQGGIYWEF